ncbi:MAG: c-type cytochrome, partial [Thermodesulfobacteriota bacterium]
TVLRTREVTTRMGRIILTPIILVSILPLSIISCTKNEEKQKEEIVAAEAKIEGNTSRGKLLYNEKCANCHGPTGQGDGPQAALLDPKPTNLSDAKYMSTLTDELIFITISEGGIAVGKSNLMPRWKFVLLENDIWIVVAYIRKDICECEYKGS